MKDLERIRNNIRRRKGKNTGKIQSPEPLPDEERYGLPGQPPVRNIQEGEQAPLKRWVLQITVSAVIFSGVTFMYHGPLEPPKTMEAFMTKQLKDEFPFAKVTAVYQNRLGKVFPSVEEEEVTSSPFPLNGSVEVSGNGVEITPQQGGSVTAVKEGTVVFAGKKPETGPTVIVQHADGTNSVYGNLEKVQAHLYQYVEQGEAIAEVEEGLFFARKRGEVFLNPYEVIEVNEDY
ncbi:M23 family metallopeptidase [Salimicrobium halophilum]|uniref:Stage IV sporulation protein FA n=1 Tax=Salimicrobium halophilum TaxID=86666 RepID=A0A1G8PKH5_9BACI|nr:M23 family metallopeptidase [Salimicrobium halophilum]SDI92778.1 stage IV sporulation protein FA [Salimicrobium halophilum]